MDLDDNLKFNQTSDTKKEAREHEIYALFLDNNLRLIDKEGGDSMYGYNFDFYIPDGQKDLYFGLTKQSVKVRWQQHDSEISRTNILTTRKLYKRALEVGIDKFKRIKLMDNLTLEEAKATEIYLISKYDTYNNGLNSTRGGETWGYGIQHSEAIKMSYEKYPQRKIYISELMKTIWENDHQRHIDMSIRMAGENNPCYGKFGSLHPAFGIKRTPGQILNMSGEKHHCFGKFGEEHQAFGYKKTLEQVSKTSGENHGLYGKIGIEHPAFGKTWTKSLEQRAAVSGEHSHKYGMTGALSSRSKPVCVWGKVYPAAQTASDVLRTELAPTNKTNFIKHWTRIKKRQPYVFYITKEFYAHAVLFEIDNVTRSYYDMWSSL